MTILWQGTALNVNEERGLQEGTKERGNAVIDPLGEVNSYCL